MRDALQAVVGHLTAHPDGRLVYKTNPVSLLEADGELRESLVAGARFVLNTQSRLRQTHVIDYYQVRARCA